MLENIISIEENFILIKLQNVSDTNLINKYVMLDDENHKFVGEITTIKEDIAYINLLGEIINQKFIVLSLYSLGVLPVYSLNTRLNVRMLSNPHSNAASAGWRALS